MSMLEAMCVPAAQPAQTPSPDRSQGFSHDPGTAPHTVQGPVFWAGDAAGPERLKLGATLTPLVSIEDDGSIVWAPGVTPDALAPHVQHMPANVHGIMRLLIRLERQRLAAHAAAAAAQDVQLNFVF